MDAWGFISHTWLKKMRVYSSGKWKEEEEEEGCVGRYTRSGVAAAGKGKEEEQGKEKLYSQAFPSLSPFLPFSILPFSFNASSKSVIASPPTHSHTHIHTHNTSTKAYNNRPIIYTDKHVCIILFLLLVTFVVVVVGNQSTLSLLLVIFTVFFLSLELRVQRSVQRTQDQRF